MQQFVAIMLLGMDLVCVLRLYCSLWPGRLEVMWLALSTGWAFVPFAVQLLWRSIPILLIGVPVVLSAVAVIWLAIRLWRRSLKRSESKFFRQTFFNRYGLRSLLLATITMVFATHILMQLNLPMQLALRLSETAFAAQVSDAPVADTKSNAAGLFERLGLYSVDYYARDRRGGIYFATSQHQILGVSYGFAYQPNHRGCPFGDSGYAIEPVVGEWYWFRSITSEG